MPRRYIYADEDKDDDELIWDALGRGSAAGRHLYNLYNGNTDGKRFGNMQSAYNGEVESRKTAEERRLPMDVEEAIKRDEAFLRSTTLKRWQVNVPGGFTGTRKPTEDEELRLKFEAQRRAGQSRKPEATIRREMRADPDFNGTSRAPKPAKPLLGEAEKRRLQRLREFNGRPPEVVRPQKLSERSKVKEQPRRKTQREQLEELFDAVVGEIEEREAFLHEMRAHGRGDRYEHAIRAEIAERVNQLRGLDERLNAV